MAEYHKGASLPTRGGWIEIRRRQRTLGLRRSPSPHGEGGLKWDKEEIRVAVKMSLPTRGGWIEISARLTPFSPLPSLPTRGEWIEIPPAA